MKIDWKAKMSSRKFWAFLGSFVTSILLAFNLSENEIAQVVAIITSFGSMAIYVLSEASVDKAAIKQEGDE
jgi:hypothetical protein